MKILLAFWHLAARMLVVVAMAAVTTLAVVAPAAAKCDEGETVIKLSHTAPISGHPKSAAADSLAQQVNEAMNGQFCVHVFPNSTRYDDAAVLQALADNKVQIALPPTTFVGERVHPLRIFDLPFLFRDMEAVEWFQNTAVMKSILHTLEAGGWIGLGFWNDGMKQMGANRSIKLPFRMKGVRVRVVDSEIIKAQFSHLKAESIVLPFKETYPSLIKGSIDGQEDTWTNMYTKRFFEVSNHMAETNHGVLSYIVLVSSDFYNSLSEDARRQLRDIIDSVTAENNLQAKEMERSSREKIVAEGGVVYELSELQRSAWMQALKPVWAEFDHDIESYLIDLAKQANAESQKGQQS